MKRTFIITVPIVVIVITILGYASNFVSERYYWEPKYRFAKTYSPDFKYQVDKFIPFILTAESEGHHDGNYLYERVVVFQFFSVWGKVVSYDRREKQ